MKPAKITTAALAMMLVLTLAWAWHLERRLERAEEKADRLADLAEQAIAQRNAACTQGDAGAR